MLHEFNSDLETVTLNCAEALAEYVHFGQKDKQGRPYIEHVVRVAKACKGLSLDQRVAAILHDTIEDCADRITLNMIGLLFGESVAGLVSALTHEKEYGDSYSQYIERISLVPLAIPIKLADLTDNLDPARGPIPDSLRERYEKATAKLIAPYVERGLKAYIQHAKDSQAEPSDRERSSRE